MSSGGEQVRGVGTVSPGCRMAWSLLWARQFYLPQGWKRRCMKQSVRVILVERPLLGAIWGGRAIRAGGNPAAFALKEIGYCSVQDNVKS